MKKSKAYHEKKSRARAQHHADNRRASLKAAPPVARQSVMWLGNRRPSIAPKSTELILFRLEHLKDETKRILTRPERGMRVLALNGRVIEYRRATA